MGLLHSKLWDLHINWEEFGRALPVKEVVINGIKANYPGLKGNRERLVDVLDRWRKRGGRRTWKVICDALIAIRKKNVSDEIEKEHLNLECNGMHKLSYLFFH